MTGHGQLDYQRIFRALPGLYLLLTPDLVMLDSTDARLHATMTHREDIVGRQLFDVFPDDPYDASATGVKNLRASLDRVCRTRTHDVMPIQKYSLRRPASAGGGYEERYWCPMNVPIIDDHGAISYIIHRVEDVTELVRAINDLAVASADSESTAAARERVAATMFRQAQDLQESNHQLRRANLALEERSAALHEARAHADEQRRRAIGILENMKLTEEAGARTQATVRLLGTVAIAANEAPNASEAFRSALHAVCMTLDWPIGHALGTDGDSQRILESGACAHLSSSECESVLRRAMLPSATTDQDSLPARVVAQTAPVFFPDLWDDPRFRDRGLLARAGVASGVGIPVTVRREVRGVLEFFFAATAHVGADTLAALGQIGTQLGRVIEREEAADVRRQLLERLVLAQEEERLRISRELHDQMGQHLVALAIGVQSLRAAAPSDSIFGERVDQLEALAERIGTDARQLAVRLRPTLLDDFGLASAVRAHVARWSEDTSIPVHLEVSAFEDRRLPTAVETAVYRIIQEALTNVARHAGATHVNVMLDASGSRLYAIVEDDGRGFNVDGAGGVRRLGLLGMSERAALVGGSLTLQSAPGAGTAVLARFPIDGTTGITDAPDESVGT